MIKSTVKSVYRTTDLSWTRATQARSWCRYKALYILLVDTELQARKFIVKKTTCWTLDQQKHSNRKEVKMLHHSRHVLRIAFHKKAVNEYYNSKISQYSTTSKGTTSLEWMRKMLVELPT